MGFWIFFCCQRLNKPEDCQTLFDDTDEAGCSSDDGSVTTADAGPAVHVPEHSPRQLIREMQLIVHVLEENQPQQFSRETQLVVHVPEDDMSQHIARETQPVVVHVPEKDTPQSSFDKIRRTPRFGPRRQLCVENRSSEGG